MIYTAKCEPLEMHFRRGCNGRIKMLLPITSENTIVIAKQALPVVSASIVLFRFSLTTITLRQHQASCTEYADKKETKKSTCRSPVIAFCYLAAVHVSGQLSGAMFRLSSGDGAT